MKTKAAVLWEVNQPWSIEEVELATFPIVAGVPEVQQELDDAFFAVTCALKLPIEFLSIPWVGARFAQPERIDETLPSVRHVVVHSALVSSRIVVVQSQ